MNVEQLMMRNLPFRVVDVRHFSFASGFGIVFGFAFVGRSILGFVGWFRYIFSFFGRFGFISWFVGWFRSIFRVFGRFGFILWFVGRLKFLFWVSRSKFLVASGAQGRRHVLKVGGRLNLKALKRSWPRNLLVCQGLP